MGAVTRDFRERCNEIDDRKRQQREGQPTNKEMLNAAMLDLKAQIDEYEQKVTAATRKSQSGSD